MSNDPSSLQPALQLYAAAAAAQFSPRTGMVNWRPFLQFGMSFLNHHSSMTNMTCDNDRISNCVRGIKNSNKLAALDHSSLNPTSSSDDSNDDQSKYFFYFCLRRHFISFLSKIFLILFGGKFTKGAIHK